MLKKEGSLLNEKLQMQKETATLSLNKVLKDNQDMSIALHTKSQETSEKLNEVVWIRMPIIIVKSTLIIIILQIKASFVESQQEVAKVQVENKTLRHSLLEEIRKTMKLKLELREQVSKTINNVVNYINFHLADEKNKGFRTALRSLPVYK